MSPESSSSSTQAASSQDKPKHRLDDLPTEILELIFLNVGTSNLIKASPRIARQLSSEPIYRAYFFITFFPHVLGMLRKHFDLSHLLPETVLVTSSMENRRMMKTVLHSRWCTLGWVANLQKDLIQKFLLYAKEQLNVSIPSETERLLQHRLKHEKTKNCGKYGSHIGNFELLFQGSEFELGYLVLSSLLKISLDQPDTLGGNTWELVPRCLGERTICKIDLLTCQYSPDTPFWNCILQHIDVYDFGQGYRDLVRALAPSDHRRIRNSLWFKIHGQVKTLALDSLCDTLELCYLFYEDDEPFLIDREIFISALSGYSLSAFPLLCNVDPQTASTLSTRAWMLWETELDSFISENNDARKHQQAIALRNSNNRQNHRPRDMISQKKIQELWHSKLQEEYFNDYRAENLKNKISNDKKLSSRDPCELPPVKEDIPEKECPYNPSNFLEWSDTDLAVSDAEWSDTASTASDDIEQPPMSDTDSMASDDLEREPRSCAPS